MQPCCGVQQRRLLRLNLWMQQQKKIPLITHKCVEIELSSIGLLYNMLYIDCVFQWRSQNANRWPVLSVIGEDQPSSDYRKRGVNTSAADGGMQVAPAVFIYFFAFYQLSLKARISHLFNYIIMFKSMYFVSNGNNVLFL